MSIRRIILSLAVSFGLLLFSLGALKQINASADQDLSTAQSRLAANWSMLEAIEPGDEAQFESIAMSGVSILERAPLDDDVLTQIALARHSALTQEGVGNRGSRDAETVALLRAAQDRSPRNRLVATTLYQHALSAGQFDEAVKQIDLLYRITHPQRRARRDQVALLAALISLQSSRSSVSQALAEAPIWGSPLIQYLSDNRVGAGLSAVSDYLDLYAQKADPATVQRLASGLIRQLTEDNQFENAHTVWTRFWPQASQAKSSLNGLGLNADPDFKRTAPPPFGWVAFANRHGSADFEPLGGLYAVYLDGPRTVLAEQIFLWPARPFTRLKITAAGIVTDQPRSGHFQVSVDCFLGREGPTDVVSIGTLDLSGPLKATGQATAEFADINQNCRAGRLRLVGIGGEISQTISMTLEALSVTLPATEGGR